MKIEKLEIRIEKKDNRVYVIILVPKSFIFGMGETITEALADLRECYPDLEIDEAIVNALTT